MYICESEFKESIAYWASVAVLDCQHEKANSKETRNLIIINCCEDVLSSSNIITYSVSEVF